MHEETRALSSSGERWHRCTDANEVRRKLSLSIFIYTAGASVMAQVTPKVVLSSYDGDDRLASKFHGWLEGAVSVLTFISVPVMSGLSDTVGRRGVISWAYVLHAASVCVLAATPNALESVIFCQVMAGLCSVIIPVSQAIMVDVAGDESKASKGDASRGLGLAFAAFGLATAAGDLIGGSLSEDHRSIACLICAGVFLLALASLHFYGWEETAPRRRFKATGEIESVRGTDESRRSELNNPFSIMRVFLESRLLLRISLCYFLFVVALNVFATGYNYFDYRFHWTPLQISIFFASYNITMALASGGIIRWLVPHRLSEEYGALFGITAQACGMAIYGLCFLGWMLFPALLLGSLANVTEPCLQAVMARFAIDRQGGLQGAAMSLRILAEGVAALIYANVFSAGSSVGFEEAPFFVASAISVLTLAVTLSPLRKLSKIRELSDPAVEDIEGADRASWMDSEQERQPDVRDVGTPVKGDRDVAEVPVEPFHSPSTVSTSSGTEKSPPLIVAPMSSDRFSDELTEPLLGREES